MRAWVRPWLIVIVPLLLGGLVVSALLVTWGNALPIVYLRADLGTAVALVSLCCSLLIAAWLLVRSRLQHVRQQSISAVQQELADNRRRFLQRLDHELKNPLMAMRAGLANIAAQPHDPTGHAALQSVEAQAVRLGRLVTELRKLADLETRPLERTAIDPTLLLHDVMTLAHEHAAAPARQLRLTLPQVSWSLPTLTGDYDLLFLALYNLTDNALKFTQPGDTVEVRAFEDSNTLVIEVADTGPGIADDEQAAVWQELYRSPAARGITGSGLGLPLVQAIVQRHGGQVSLRSRLEQGTVVTLRLPAQG